MKKTRLKQSRPFLKIGLKKISYSVKPSVILICFFVGFPLLGEQIDVEVEVTSQNEIVSFDILVSEYPTREIMDALANGYRSEVTYTVKIFQVNTGIFSFFGDRLVDEESYSRIAGWDRFEEAYFIIEGDNTRNTFHDKINFFRGLFILRNFRLTFSSGEPGETKYALVTVQIKPVHLIPPLTIINLLKKRNIVTSPAKKVPL